MASFETKRAGDRPILPYLAALFFILTFAIKAFTDGAYDRGEISSAVVYTKYITAAISCFIAMTFALKRGERHFVFEMNGLALILFVFTLVTLLLQIVHGQFVSLTYVELFKLAMPMVLAYSLLNALSEKQIYCCMLCVLGVSVAGYLVDLKHAGTSILDFASANFFESNSATESSGFSGLALMLVFYFVYVKRNNVASVISVLFSILTFKRLAVVTTAVVLLLGICFPSIKERRVSNRVTVFLKTASLVAVFLWSWILLPKQETLFISIFGDTPFDFTLGRSDSLRYLLSSSFTSFGFGSTNDLINSLYGVPFEMDFARIAIELSPLALILFIWVFWDVARRNVWSLLIIGFFVLNMITSDSLSSNFVFTLAYIVIGTVNARAENSDIQTNRHTISIESSNMATSESE